ncbi:MAG: hypothetical protein Q4G05_03305 [Clostridia bacterium]|nr:hypothetical protein [Clostridia bacterium]
MNIFVIILCIYTFIKTVSYAFFEYSYQKNKIAGIAIFITSLLTLLSTLAIIIFVI